MGTGYTRQSDAAIEDGNIISAEDLELEFDAIQAAFNKDTGHSHDGTVGEGPKISLTTSISGILPIANGGIAGIHKLNATTAPTVNDDVTNDYVVGSIWIDTTNNLFYICLDNTDGAAIWQQFQPLDTDLTAIAALTSAADKVPYATGAGTWALADFSAFGRSLVDDAAASNARTTLGLGSMATQNSSAVSISGGTVTGITDLAVADGGTGSSTAAGARTNLGLGSIATVNSPVPIADGGTGSTSASAARSALGLGTAAVLNTGTSGGNIPLLNGTNTWSGNQTVTGQILGSGGTVATPDFSWSSDPNTGFYSLGNGIVGLGINGALKVTFNATTLDMDGTISATTFSGSGSSLTNLPAANLTGTIDKARLPSSIDSIIIGGSNNTSYLGTPISTLTGGSTGGGLIEAPTNSHLVVGIKDNDVGDSFSIVSRNGSADYTKLVARFSADGSGYIGNNTTVNGNLTVNGTFSATGIDADTIDGVDSSALARTSTSITAGNGLTGGGTLAASRTVTLGTPGTITGSSTNAVTSTSHTHALTLVSGDVTGALGYTPASNAVSITAGNGMTGGGTLSASRTLTLGTPSTITGSTTNSVTSTSHTHALTITASDIPLQLNTSNFGRPSDFWTSGVGSYISCGSVGWIGTNGSNDLFIMSNHYRNDSGTATNLGSGGGSAASSIRFSSSSGDITFQQASSWPTGSATNPSVRFTFSSGGNLTATGTVTASSDERFKIDWKELPDNFIDKLAEVRSGTYYRTDIDQIQVGVGAQSLNEVLPEAVYENDEGYLSVAYGNAALAACVAMAKKIKELEKRLAELEK